MKYGVNYINDRSTIDLLAQKLAKIYQNYVYGHTSVMIKGHNDGPFNMTRVGTYSGPGTKKESEFWDNLYNKDKDQASFYRYLYMTNFVNEDQYRLTRDHGADETISLIKLLTIVQVDEDDQSLVLNEDELRFIDNYGLSFKLEERSADYFGRMAFEQYLKSINDSDQKLKSVLELMLFFYDDGWSWYTKKQDGIDVDDKDTILDPHPIESERFNFLLDSPFIEAPLYLGTGQI